MRPKHERELIRSQIERLDEKRRNIKPGEMHDLIEVVNPPRLRINKQVIINYSNCQQ